MNVHNTPAFVFRFQSHPWPVKVRWKRARVTRSTDASNWSYFRFTSDTFKRPSIGGAYQTFGVNILNDLNLGLHWKNCAMLWMLTAMVSGNNAHADHSSHSRTALGQPAAACGLADRWSHTLFMQTIVQYKHRSPCLSSTKYTLVRAHTKQRHRL